MSILSQLALSEFQLAPAGRGRGDLLGGEGGAYGGGDVGILRGAYLGSCSHDTHSGE